MNIEVDKKAKLGKGASHVLQTSTIQELLEDLDLKVFLNYNPYYRRKIDYQLLLSCSISPTSRPTESTSYISMYVYGVKSEEKEVLEGLLEEKAFPALVNWLKKLMAYPTDSTIFLQEHKFEAEYTAQELVIKKSV